MNVVANGLGHLVKKIGPRCNHVGVEKLSDTLVGQSSPFGFPICSKFCLFPRHFLTFLCCAKSSCPLLIHLCSWCHTIDGHIDQLLGPSDSDQSIQVQKNVLIHVFLILW